MPLGGHAGANRCQCLLETASVFGIRYLNQLKLTMFQNLPVRTLAVSFSRKRAITSYLIIISLSHSGPCTPYKCAPASTSLVPTMPRTSSLQNIFDLQSETVRDVRHSEISNVRTNDLRRPHTHILMWSGVCVKPHPPHFRPRTSGFPSACLVGSSRLVPCINHLLRDDQQPRTS